jgi:serine phosphatase RsbU (regulator of sigma subunit)
MSLRTRLILAFFALSVVPLGAVTFYAYTANVNALRDAAEREADLLAGELGQRMQLVTAQLSERVEHLMDVAELQSAAEQASLTAERVRAEAAAPPASTTVVRAVDDPAKVLVGPVVVTHTALTDSIAKSLGEAAMLLNNVELQNIRGGAGGRGGGGGPPRSGGGGANRNPPPPGAPAPPAIAPAPPSAAVTGTGAATTSAPAPTPAAGRAQEPRVQRYSARTVPSGRQGSPSNAAAQQAQGSTSTSPATPLIPGVPSAWTTVDQSGKVKIDMGPIRREMFRQILPEGRAENLTPEERQRVAAEINQRMLGIEQGIKLSAAELTRQAQAAERAGKAASVQKPKAATPPRVDASLKRRSTLSGSHIDVKVERDGQVVRQMNAEINLPNVLATVFTTTRGDRGELPFAVAKDGTIYAKSEADKGRVAALGEVAKPGGPATARMRDWIVVTTEDKSGSGLRLGIARPVTDSLAALRRTAARNTGLGLLFIAVALVGIVPLSAGLTRNLTSLSEAAGRISKGEYHTRVPVRANDEVGKLAVAFNSMAADVERHQRTAVEQERIRRELELGRQIQNEMLPHAPLHLGLTEVQGVSVPAREVGGDFFNYFVLDSGHIALLMGDVSGKGVGAALLMANIQAALKIRLGLGQDLSAVADAIDRDIDANSPGPVYATLFIGILEPATRRLRYVNAGHNPQFVLRVEGLAKMHATGLPVGLLSGRGYSEQTVQLSEGDFLFLYTDGCVEAENERGEMFGMDRLELLLTASAKSRDPLKHVEQGIAEFRGSSEPSDDATLMTVRVG